MLYNNNNYSYIIVLTSTVGRDILPSSAVLLTAEDFVAELLGAAANLGVLTYDVNSSSSSLSSPNIDVLTAARTHQIYVIHRPYGGSVAEWLACWTQVQKAWVQIAAVTLSGNSLRQTVHTHHAFVHQTAKLVAALLKVAGVTAGLAESNDSLPPGL